MVALWMSWVIACAGGQGARDLSAGADQHCARSAVCLVGLGDLAVGLHKHIAQPVCLRRGGRLPGRSPAYERHREAVAMLVLPAGHLREQCVAVTAPGS